jgi:hypothetical protein
VVLGFSQIRPKEETVKGKVYRVNGSLDVGLSSESSSFG